MSHVHQGFAIVFPAAFLTMLIATRNIIIAPLAIVTIAGIVSSVRGGGFNKDRAPPQLLGLPRCSMELEISMGLYGARL